VRRFSLDTSCVLAAVNGEPASTDIEQLVKLARSGKIEIVITSGFEVDQRRAAGAKRQANLEWLACAPISPVPGPFRRDMSTFDGPDVFLDDNDTSDVDEAITKILIPEHLRPPNVRMEDLQKASKRMQDVHHLTSHHMSKGDAFVTLDDDDMIRKRTELKAMVGIVIVTPSEALSLARSGAWTPDRW
jgi:hypothetical protein